jgi:hypothetical protein
VSGADTFDQIIDGLGRPGCILEIGGEASNERSAGVVIVDGVDLAHDLVGMPRVFDLAWVRHRPCRQNNVSSKPSASTKPKRFGSSINGVANCTTESMIVCQSHERSRATSDTERP